MKLSVLVPFGADDSETGKQRRRVWAFIRDKWSDHPHLELVEGHDPLFPVHHVYGQSFGETTVSNTARPFSVSRALNDAAGRATGDAFLLFGADHLPDGKAILYAQEQILRHPWVRLFDRIGYASVASTSLLLHRFAIQDTDWHVEPAPCDGVLAVRRTAWERVGGMDESFEGWGYEDTDLMHRLQHLVDGGRYEASGRILRELYVPSPRDLNGTNRALYERKHPR